jgi:hypothetical protein
VAKAALMPDLLLDDLRKAVTRKGVLVVVGAGVSVWSTNRARAASWTGLLETGIDRCDQLGRTPSKDWAARRRRDLRSGDLRDVLAVAEQVAGRLSAQAASQETVGGEYRRWLRETVGALKVERQELIRAIAGLRVPIATTNYDGLIERVTRRPPVTWRDRARVERVLRGDERGVLHLHGHWQEPESVILGVRSYETVMGDEHAQAVLRALRLTRSLLFVGFGAGLADPNFSALLAWIRRVLPGSEYRDFRLARSSETAGLRSQHQQDTRLVVLSYGRSYDDLAPFLKKLRAMPSGRRPSSSGGTGASAVARQPGRTPTRPAAPSPEAEPGRPRSPRTGSVSAPATPHTGAAGERPRARSAPGATAPPAEPGALARAVALVPERRGSSRGLLCLIVVPSRHRQVLRPAELERQELADRLAREARFGRARVLDPDASMSRRIDGDSLVIEQADASIHVDEAGAIRLLVKATTEGERRGAFDSSVLIEEDVRHRIGVGLRFAAWGLDQIDARKTVTEVAIVAGLVGASYMGWRTRAEHDADPTSYQAGRADDRVVVPPTPFVVSRCGYRRRVASLAEDLMVLLRRAVRA